MRATFRGKYDSVRQDNPEQITGVSKVDLQNGASFSVEDVYRVVKNHVFMTRHVRVIKAPADVTLGFNTEYLAQFTGTSSRLNQLHFFSPGVWYNQNANAAPGGIGRVLAPSDQAFWKETRTTLPLVMMQTQGGATFALAHAAEDASGAPLVSSGIDESDRSWVVDASVKYGALGIQASQCDEGAVCASIGFRYPASERRGGAGGGPKGKWVLRSHPVRDGFEQTYTLLLSLDSKVNNGSFSPATEAGFFHYRDTWRMIFDLYHPSVSMDTTAKLWESNISLLNTVFDKQGPEQAPGLPFKIGNLVTGKDNPYSYQMGFTGQQIPLGFQLLRSGVLSHTPALVEKGKEILDFWSIKEAKDEKSGLPLTWYQPNDPVDRRWMNFSCNRPIFLRTVSDGMEGMAAATIFALQHLGAVDKLELRSWTRFADSFGEWLLAHQEEDGSFRRAFNADGSVWKPGGRCPNPGEVDGMSKFSTSFPIRFLAMMAVATGNEHYKTAAYRAGDWALHNIYATGTYIGGVTNHNSLDKEAGAEALEAALALYDLNDHDGNKQGQQKWLQASEAAADYLETWQYAWDFYPADHTPDHLFRAYTFAGTRASSLIGSGESGSDVFLAIASFDFYRLHLLTGETPEGHYGRFAELLANNTSLATQMSTVAGQNFGWKYDGLTGEAVDLSMLSFRADQTPIGWLAWISNAQLSPLQRLEDAFGTKSVTQLLTEERSSSARRKQLEESNHNVLPRTGSVQWPPDGVP